MSFDVCVSFCLSISWWNLDCFYLLAVMSNAAMKMGVQIFLQCAAFTSLGHILRSRILDHVEIFNFWNHILFSTVAALFCIAD